MTLALAATLLMILALVCLVAVGSYGLNWLEYSERRDLYRMILAALLGIASWWGSTIAYTEIMEQSRNNQTPVPDADRFL